ncbi:SdpI family protein [Corynebacterium sp. TAE3-ERU30]|uniref:SdpI family protein n=1 Tax=Corynebacterium sp. TAE3-ERU30 TaxID=2849496 RepID=UPI001C474690|nr:SdpI family protein [Corynebacterium sp. TAE3-ERU30]MBV7282356.1 SdpI family protein [Corynebacterium sp. TAE3-ERU30]
MAVLGIILLILTLALLILGALAWTQHLPGNGLIGIRVPEVRTSREMWNAAHKVAGPVWLVAGLAMGIGALLAFSAAGWMWLLVLAAVVASVTLLGIGAALGAKAVAIIDANRKISDAAAAQAGDSESQAPQPEVDVDKLRSALRRSQNQDET